MNKPPLTTAKEFKIAVLTLIGVRLRNEARGVSMAVLEHDNGIKHRERVQIMRALYEAIIAIKAEGDDE